MPDVFLLITCHEFLLSFFFQFSFFLCFLFLDISDTTLIFFFFFVCLFFFFFFFLLYFSFLLFFFFIVFADVFARGLYADGRFILRPKERRSLRRCAT